MYLKHLWYLHLVVVEGGFAAAARAAGVSQPAITMAIQALEQEWGMPLFEKVGRQKRPTRTALTVATRVAELQGQIKVLTQEETPLEELLRESPRPTLRIGLAPAACLLYGPLIEKAWREHEPDGLLSIVSSSAPEMLHELYRGDLDFVIAPRPRKYEVTTFKCHIVHSSTPTVYARKDHPLASATSLMDISKAGWAVAGRAGTAGSVIEEAHRVRRLPPPRILVQCADYLTLSNIVANTDLLCVIPHFAILQVQQHSAIAPLMIREGLPQYDVGIFWPSRPDGTAKDSVVSVIDAFIESLA